MYISQCASIYVFKQTKLHSPEMNRILWVDTQLGHPLLLPAGNLDNFYLNDNDIVYQIINTNPDTESGVYTEVQRQTPVAAYLKSVCLCRAYTPQWHKNKLIFT